MPSIKFDWGWSSVETMKFLRGLLVTLSGAALLYLTTVVFPNLTTQQFSFKNLLLFMLFQTIANALKLLTTENKPS